MPLNKALSLPSSELDLVQTILEEAIDMHTDPVAVRDQVLDVLQLNLQQPKEFVLERFGAVVDELLAHMNTSTRHLSLAIDILRAVGFTEEANLLLPALDDRKLLIRATPGLEKRLRAISNFCPAESDAELNIRYAAWRALENLTYNAEYGVRKVF